MSFINPNVDINGCKAKLTQFEEAFASINIPDHTYRHGEICDFTIFVKLMGKEVPVRLRAEVVQPHGEEIDVMFSAPTQNWSRLIQMMRHRERLL